MVGSSYWLPTFSRIIPLSSTLVLLYPHIRKIFLQFGNVFLPKVLALLKAHGAHREAPQRVAPGVQVSEAE